MIIQWCTGLTGDTEINARQSQPVLLTTTSTWVESTAMTSCSNPEVPRKTLKWYKKLAIHFMKLSMLNSFTVYQKDGGQKPFHNF